MKKPKLVAGKEDFLEDLSEQAAPHALNGHLSDRGEDASSAELPADFDELLYLILNPDVAEAVRKGDISSGKLHWELHGATEEKAGLRPSIHHSIFYKDQNIAPPTAEELAEFDSQYYLTTNPDVAALGNTAQNALDHWIQFGRREGRAGVRSKQTWARSANAVRLMQRPFGVNLFAPFSAQSGLGTTARGFLQAIRVANIPVHPVNYNIASSNENITTWDYNQRPPYRVNIIQANADTIVRFKRWFRPGWFDDTYSIAIWAWELNALRPDWYPSFREVDEVWTLSKYSTEAIGICSPVPVLTMNPPVVPAMATNLDRTYFNLPDGFLFMTAFDVGSSLERKNPMAVVNAFIEAFSGSTDVFLILKFHSVKFDVCGVQTMLRRVREVPNIIIRSQLITDVETRALQACVDCLVSAHRSEGFGLNIAEFMLTGKPVIATGYSGNMDFTESDNSYLVPFVLEPLEHSSGPYLPGYLWAQPDHEALIAHMKRVAADPLEARQVGARGAATIRDRLSIEGIGRRIASRFDELGLTGTLPGFVYHLGNFSKIEPLPPELCTPVADPAELARHPKISVIVPVYNGAPEYLVACIDSVREQTYSNWELCLCNDGSSSAPTLEALGAYQGVDPRIHIKHLMQSLGTARASNAAATMASGTWLVMLDSHDTLASNALAEIAAAVSNNAAIDALYADEDKLNAAGECCDTFFKPDWSPEHLESVMYTLHPLIVRASLFWKLGGFRHEYSGAQDWDLMLRVSRCTNMIHHIPKILYHWRINPGSLPANVHAKSVGLDVEAHVLIDHVSEKYGTGNAVVEPTPLGGQYRVKHVIKENPPVTLIITTNNKRLRLPNRESFVSVRNLINSIMEKTSYQNYRILVVDNYDTPRNLKDFWEKNNISLISYIGSMKPFNYPDKVNFAVNSLKTEHVVLMHDNIKVVNAEWLSALLEFSQNPEIGACSGKILHDNGTIQHVGIVLGIGGSSAHIYHGFPGDYVGYNGYTHVIRNYSAVTGALLATRRSVLNEVGSWDRRLAGNYNDVDICLRMRQHGYRIVYTPHSLVMHFEEKTASEKTLDSSEVALFNTLWEPLIKNDPYYNPNLSRTRNDFSLQ